MRRNKAANRSFSFLLYDVKNAVKGNWLKTVPVFILCFVICFEVNRKISFLFDTHLAGVWNYVVYAYAGMEEYFSKGGLRFEIPVYWLLLTLYVPYLAGSYAYDEMHNGAGLQALIRMKNRAGWFIGKVLYCLTCVLFFHLIVLAGFIFFSMILNGSLQSSDAVNCQLVGANMDKMPSQWYFYASFILLPVMESVFLSILQVLISIVLKPVFAYLLVVVYVIASVYWRSVFLIADYTMFLRNKCFIWEGTDSYQANLLLFILIIAEIIIGIFVFQKKDLLKKEEADSLWK